MASPHLDAVRVERVWAEGGTVHVPARTRELRVACPDCGHESARVHSRYGRTLADVAVAGRPVLISLLVRRLFCDSQGCGRRTFAEQVDGLTVPYQRRSPLLQHLVEMAGVLLAGRGGARLLRILKVRLSRTSGLFHLMRVRLPSAATPWVLGVDDFALYADVYGTLLVDADTPLPIELWAGRDAEQLAAWLRTHPGVHVVCRDGSLTYRQGITDGAPKAVQVSDRFHLWQGLSKRVSDIAAAHRSCLTAAVPEPEPAMPSASSAALSEVADTPARRHAKALFEAVHAVTNTGRSLSAAARELGLNRRTVGKYARAVTGRSAYAAPHPAEPPGSTRTWSICGSGGRKASTPRRCCTRRLSPRATGATTSGSRWPSHRSAVACRSMPRANGRPRPARLPDGSPPRRPAAACTPPRHSGDCSRTARNWTEPTTWCVTSPPCSTPATPLRCRSGTSIVTRSASCCSVGRVEGSGRMRFPRTTSSGLLTGETLRGSPG
ncbi:transposase [Streptomyces sp. NPDC003233]